MKLRCLLLVLLFPASAKMTPAQFVHVQGSGNNYANATNTSVRYSTTPAHGHLLTFWMFVLSSDGVTPITNLQIKDAHNNAFTLTPVSAANSGGNGSASVGQVFAGYILSAPSNMAKLISATWTGNSQSYWTTLYIEDFSYTGTAAFDKEAFYASVNYSVTGTAINQPSIMPSAAGELLYAGAQGTSAMVSVNSPWTISGGGYSTYDTDANTGYILSSSSSPTAVDFTQTDVNYWAGYIMAFSLRSAKLK